MNQTDYNKQQPVQRSPYAAPSPNGVPRSSNVPRQVRPGAPRPNLPGQRMQPAITPRPSEIGLKVKRKKLLQKQRIILTAVAVSVSFIVLVACLLIFSKPKLTLKGSDVIEVEVFDEFSDPGCKASFLFFNLTDKIALQEDPSTSEIGEYEKEYSLSHFGRTYSVTRAIHVVDKTPPTLQLDGDLELTLSSMDFFQEQGYAASDNYDGDLTAAVTVSREYDENTSTCILTYSVQDSSGNTSHAQRSVSVKDVIPPELVLLGNTEIYTHAAKFTDPGYKATDDLAGDLTGAVVVETDYKACTVGDFTFTYTVSDGAGNTVSAQRFVHVTDTTSPKMSLLGNQTMKIHLGEAFADPGVKATDDFDGNVTDKVTAAGEVDSNKVGTYTITYSVADACGNAAQITRSVVVAPSSVVLDVPFIDQRAKWPNGCESVSAVMALKHVGVDISVDAFIDNYLDMCDLPYFDENGKRWGYSPNDYFIGNPRLSTGLCCYAPVIKKACDKFTPAYGHTAKMVSGATLASLSETYVANGTPVIVWASLQMKAPYYNGKQWTIIGTNTVFKWKAPMHCMLLTGFDDDYYYFNDPMVGKNVKYAKSKSEKAFQGMGSQAIVIQ